MYGEDIIKN